ncbi:hypothetical protein GTH32_18710 [Alteromonas sp. 345S023]|uniref:Uncharacterized protein n=1 Tax=Alteromonas profundi TaxID=2696062 RepID=A0A7X5LPK8_9ALTE|nr:hypothetical protein [Alteromonas profundi]NDV93206.1 hypothetical protein [Alteromonas profundi]
MKHLALLGLAVAGFSCSALAMAQSTKTVQIVDTQGKPPFKRKMVEIPVQDVAQFEELGEVETVRKRVVTSFNGKPPYTRRVVEVPVVDIAQFEEVSQAAQKQVKSGKRPPFKR